MNSFVSTPAVKIAIVEDHPEFRDALVAALGVSERLTLAAVCKDLPAGLSYLEYSCPDILLVDLGLPSGSGLQLIHAAQRCWGARCTSAVLTVNGNEDHLMTAVTAGAKGYIFKADQPAQWLQTVSLLAAGQSPLQATLARRFLDTGEFSRTCHNSHQAFINDLLQHIAAGYTNEEAAERLGVAAADAGYALRQVYDHLFRQGPELSARERELLALLNTGCAFRECAMLMGIAESTTKSLAKRAYEKLGATNLQMALYEARAAGLIA